MAPISSTSMLGSARAYLDRARLADESASDRRQRYLAHLIEVSYPEISWASACVMLST
jgi:hypothetical protein